MLAKGLSDATSVNGPQRRGRFLVIDFLSTGASREAIDTMTQAGLAGVGLRTTSQLPNACGYLAAGWACELRAHGNEFHEYSMAQATALNDPAFIAFNNNAALDLAHLGSSASWLTGDQILAVASYSNPDGNGQAPSWLSGPAPLNFWHVFFGRRPDACPSPLRFRITRFHSE